MRMNRLKLGDSPIHSKLGRNRRLATDRSRKYEIDQKIEILTIHNFELEHCTLHSQWMYSALILEIVRTIQYPLQLFNKCSSSPPG